MGKKRKEIAYEFLRNYDAALIWSTELPADNFVSSLHPLLRLHFQSNPCVGIEQMEF